MFCRIINRFLTLTRNIVHFGVTLNMLFTYLHIVFCVYAVIHNHTHATYIHAYIQTYTHTYLYMHTHTYLHICTLYLQVYLFIEPTVFRGKI